MNWIRLNDAAEDGGRRLDGERLGQAGHALDQEVAAGDEADEDALEHLVLARDDALDLDQRLLEEGTRLVGRALRRGALAARLPRGSWARSPVLTCALLVSTSDTSGRGRPARRPMVVRGPYLHVAGWLRSPRESAAAPSDRAAGTSSIALVDFRDTPEEARFRDEVRSWLDANLPDELRGHRGGEARFDGPEVARLEPRALRRGLGRDLLARGVRRARPLAPLPGDLPRGGGARRGAAAHRRDRPRHGRADDHHAAARRRRRRATCSRCSPPRRSGARGSRSPGRLRPRGRPHVRAPRRRPLRPRRAEGLVVVRAHRRLLHPPRPLRPRLASATPGSRT